MHTDTAARLNIKSWAEEDRPREKLMLKGKASLTDAELIAILLRTGTKSGTAVDVAKTLLGRVGNDLNELAKLSVQDLKKIKGVGEAKAIAIVSALELGRRRKDEHISEKKPLIRSSKQAYLLMTAELSDLLHEEFWIILLNRANRVMKKIRISEGGTSGTVADAKLIFKYALEELAAALILVHNHPSGNPQPSKHDVELTKNLAEAGKVLDIPVLDHIIFADEEYFSFADKKLVFGS